jgi:hypothetical protein
MQGKKTLLSYYFRRRVCFSSPINATQVQTTVRQRYTYSETGFSKRCLGLDCDSRGFGFVLSFFCLPYRTQAHNKVLGRQRQSRGSLSAPGRLNEVLRFWGCRDGPGPDIQPLVATIWSLGKLPYGGDARLTSSKLNAGCGVSRLRTRPAFG